MCCQVPSKVMPCHGHATPCLLSLSLTLSPPLMCVCMYVQYGMHIGGEMRWGPGG